MNKNVILKEIDSIERKLLFLSEKIKKANQFDSMDSWLSHVLQREHELAKSFLIPTEERFRKAILTLITSNCLLTRPLVNLLATRIASFIATAGDFKNHPMAGMFLKTISKNFEPVVKLTRRYNAHFETIKSIEMVHKALKENRVHIFKSNYMEPDLRVVLKTLQLDKDRGNKKALKYLLLFLFNQLKQNVNKKGTITDKRHSWWSFLDLITESESTWLVKNKNQLNKILKGLIEDSEYNTYSRDFISVIPEFTSIYYERIWVTINAIKIYDSNSHLLIPTKTIEELKLRIDTEIKTIINMTNDGSMRSILCNLLFLYDVLIYYNHLDAVNMCHKTKIKIQNNYIGNYIYDDNVSAQFKVIEEDASHFILDRSKWKKHILSSFLISGSSGSGKSELIDQIIIEFEELAKKAKKDFYSIKFTIGTHINSEVELSETLDKLKIENLGSNKVRTIVFDEFDKATFDFYTPFLPFLESSITNEEPITFWIFAQSSFSKFKMMKDYAHFSENKSQEDFFTRMQLGSIDLPDLNTSAQQKIFTIIGYALKETPDLKSISRKCVFYFAKNVLLKNNRDLISNFIKNTVVKEKKILFSEAIDFSVSGIITNENELINIQL